MKISIEFEHDKPGEAFLQVIDAIKASTQFADMYGAAMKADGHETITVPLHPNFDMDDEKPAPFGEMVITL